MTRLRYLTAGESHGPGLVGILEGLPSGLPLEAIDIDRDLARRQRGFGRGGRMKIEQDKAEILAGVRFARTLGSPVALVIRNRDFESWTARMSVEEGGPDERPVTLPRPGHADLAGGLKYGHTGDLRNVLERASARETAMRVALGAAARALLRDLGVQIGSYVLAIGDAVGVTALEAAPALATADAEGLALLADASETRALDGASSARFVDAIQGAQRRRDTLGGVVEVVVTGLPAGLGSHVQWDRRLDGRLARALASIPAIKAVEVGDGWQSASRLGSEVHDPILLRNGRLSRGTNHAGGVEGGISNGAPLVVRAAMKPIATVPAALPSVDLHTLAQTRAHVERSDTCAAPAAGVIAEAVVALTLADALLEALGGDTMDSLRAPFGRLRVAPRVELGHVFLLGPMGAGKSAAGPELARLLGLPFVDLDERVAAQAGASPGEIFARAGEAGFRELEATALEALCAEPPAVVALGGGAACSEASWRALRRAGVALRLDAPLSELARRLDADPRGRSWRPLISSGDITSTLRDLGRRRERYYARADLTLGTVGLSAAQVAGCALGLLRSLEGPLTERRRAQLAPPRAPS